MEAASCCWSPEAVHHRGYALRENLLRGFRTHVIREIFAHPGGVRLPVCHGIGLVARSQVRGQFFQLLRGNGKAVCFRKYSGHPFGNDGLGLFCSRYSADTPEAPPVWEASRIIKDIRVIFQAVVPKTGADAGDQSLDLLIVRRGDPIFVQNRLQVVIQDLFSFLSLQKSQEVFPRPDSPRPDGRPYIRSSLPEAVYQSADRLFRHMEIDAAYQVGQIQLGKFRQIQLQIIRIDQPDRSTSPISMSSMFMSPMSDMSKESVRPSVRSLRQGKHFFQGVFVNAEEGFISKSLSPLSSPKGSLVNTFVWESASCFWTISLSAAFSTTCSVREAG